VKVQRVQQGADGAPALELHDKVTVVRGLDPEVRAWLIATLGQFGADDEPGAVGSMVAHGIVFPLDAASLRLLDISTPVDAVVRAEDLPGHDPRLEMATSDRDRALAQRRELTERITRQREALGAAVDARAAAGEELEQVRRGEGGAREALAEAEAMQVDLEAQLAAVIEQRDRAAEAYRAAASTRDAAQAARTIALERLERARERRRLAMDAATRAAGALEQARPVAEDDPTEDLVARRAALDAAEAAASALGAAPASTALERALVAHEQRRIELVRRSEALAGEPVHPVSVALVRLEEAGSEPPPVVAALALADTWRDLHQQIAALDAGMSPEELVAQREVDDAGQAVLEAEFETNRPVLTPEQIERVEAAHAAVLEAQDKTQGRLGGGRVRRKLERAQAEERRVLERLGFATYPDYMMSASSRGVTASKRTNLESARARLAAAEAHLASLPGAADRVRRRGELLARREATAPQVELLLGYEPTGPEAEEALRALREPAVAGSAALVELANELRAVGVGVGAPPYEREDLVTLARYYLDEQGDAQTRREELEQALVALDGAITSLRAAVERGEQVPPTLPELPALAQPDPPEELDDPDEAARSLREARWSEVEAARAAVDEATERVARHRRADEVVAELEADLAACIEAEAEAAADVEAAAAALVEADGPALEQALDAVAEADGAVTRSTEAEVALRAALDAHASADPLAAVEAQARQRLADAEAAVTEAAAAEQETAAALAEVDARFAAATAREVELRAQAAALDRTRLVDDTDWELMARLASLRSVGLAGSLPLVLDDPFAALGDDEMSEVLDRLARLAGAVQVVLVTDREAAAAWAARVGDELAGVQPA
jgi:chromosome segregation protein